MAECGGGSVIAILLSVSEGPLAGRPNHLLARPRTTAGGCAGSSTYAPPMAADGASRPLRRIPAIVSFL